MKLVRLPAFAFARLLLVFAAFAAFAGAAAGAGCGGSRDGRSPGFPPREEGCTVELLHDAPEKRTVNIGPVSASCDETVAQDDCLRTLKDQACKLGGDVVWGVANEPIRKNGRQFWSGRAVHTK